MLTDCHVKKKNIVRMKCIIHGRNKTLACFLSFFRWKSSFVTRPQSSPGLRKRSGCSLGPLSSVSARSWSNSLIAHLNSSYFHQAKDRIQHYQTGEEFIFPYDLGSCWLNCKQVFTWTGTPKGDGLEWPVHPKCHQHTLTVCLIASSWVFTIQSI